MKLRVYVKLTEVVTVDVDEDVDLDEVACDIANDYPNFSGSIHDVDYEVVDE